MKKIAFLLLCVLACQRPAPPATDCADRVAEAWSSGFHAAEKVLVPSAPMSVPPAPVAVPVSAVPSPTASAEPPKTVWEPIGDDKELEALSGSWVHETKGDAVPGHKLNLGGVRVEFSTKKKGAKAPFHLKFLAPRTGHTDPGKIGGGCDYYGALHENWHKAFCRGYGIGKERGVELRLVLEREPGSKRLRFKLGDLVEAVLLREGHEEAE